MFLILWALIIPRPKLWYVCFNVLVFKIMFFFYFKFMVACLVYVIVRPWSV